MIELTAETVPAWLARQGLAGEPAAVRARELPLGVSNRTFWVERPEGPLVVKQARARLAVPMEWLADVGRIVREAEAMDWLHARLGPPEIPRLLALDRTDMALAMEAIEPPAENYKTLLLAGQVDPELAGQWGGLLARLHTVTQDAATRERFGDATFFEQLRMSPYYDTVAERHPPLAARLSELRAECMRRTWCLVHGDYSAKNMLVRTVVQQGGAPRGRPQRGGPRPMRPGAGRVLILLDYEVAHFGNPSFDLAFALTDYLMKALHLPRHAADLLHAARVFWATYEARAGLPAASRAQAGSHLAAVMLARVDGKSPFEYFTDERRQAQVRELTGALLLGPVPTVPEVIAAVAARV
jgi:5-methylthioribose kinase